jgi:hypothetical protein
MPRLSSLSLPPFNLSVIAGLSLFLFTFVKKVYTARYFKKTEKKYADETGAHAREILEKLYILSLNNIIRFLLVKTV